MEINSLKPGPRLLVAAGVHGDEFEPIRAVQILGERFESGSKLLCGTLTLIPCVNDAAFQLGQRCADDGMDLARTCPGRSDGSVTERLAAALSEQIQKADYFIDLHTGGNAYELFPLAGYMLHNDLEILRKQRMMASAMNLPLVWGTSSRLEGRSLSVARDARIPAIYCEYGGGSGVCLRAVESYVSGVQHVMSYLDMIDFPALNSAVRWAVEDDRPESGHLQVSHPSPANGFFMAAVKPGHFVHQGDLLGTVTTLQGQHMQTVSPCDGLVVMLRAFPKVSEGDALGLVLPV